jgi:hypothetical protein
MISRGTLGSFSLERPDFAPARLNFSGLFLFGRAIPADAMGFKAPGFQPSFGDWTHDRYTTAPQTIVPGPLGEAFELRATFLGRGDHFITLGGSSELRIQHRDGFMDNDFTVCLPERCLFITTTDEPVLQNISRLLNFLLEGLLIAILMALGIEVINLIAALWVKEGAGDALSASWHCLCSRIASCDSVRRAALFALLFLHAALAIMASTMLDAVPHVAESQGPYRIAELLAHGMLSLPAESAHQLRAVGIADLIVHHEHYIYPFGHLWPILLLPFMALGLPAAANIMCSLLNVVLVYLIGRREFGVGPALIAATVFGLSPLTVLLAGEYLPAPATLLMLLISCFTLSYSASRGRAAWCLLAGAAYLYAYGLRQHAAVAALPVVLALLLRTQGGSSRLSHLGYFALGAAPIAMLHLLDNYFVTGSYLLSPDAAYRNLGMRLSNLTVGVNYADSTLAFFIQMICSVPGIFIPFGFASYGLLSRFGVRAGMVGLTIVSFSGAHFFLSVHGLHAYGPRFLYEALAPMSLLIGCGAFELLRRLGGPSRKVLGAAVLVFLIAANVIRVVSILPRYEGYNGVRGASFIAQSKWLPK